MKRWGTEYSTYGPRKDRESFSSGGYVLHKVYSSNCSSQRCLKLDGQQIYLIHEQGQDKCWNKVFPRVIESLSFAVRVLFVFRGVLRRLNISDATVWFGP